MDFPRFNELFDLAVTEVLSRPTDLTETAMRTDGTDANAMIAACTAIGEELVRQVAITSRDRLISTAEDTALDDLLYDTFGLRRNDAATSIVQLYLVRAGAVAGTVYAGTRFATVDGIEFKSIADLGFAPGVFTGYVLARASVAGTAGNVGIATIVQILDTVFDSTMGVTNLAIAAGGSARENDDAFRKRARSFWQAAGRGTLQAIEFGALEVDGVGVARSTEVPLIVDGHQVGQWVSLAIAGNDGNSNTAQAALVSAAEENWRPCGVYVEVIPASRTDVDVVVTCAFKAATVGAGTDTVQAVARIRKSIAAMINSLAANETLKRDAVYELVRRDRDVATGTVVVTSPAGDLVPAPGQILRTTESRVKVN